MELKEAQQRFITSWGTLGTQWGINRTMSQIHALLLISTNPLSTEEVMEALKVSRGNVNMNMRALMDWGLVQKELVPGERKEYFKAEKDIETVSRCIARERRKREIEPILGTIQELKEVSGKREEVDEFKRVLGDIEDFTELADGALDKFIRSDRNWLVKVLMRAMK